MPFVLSIPSAWVQITFMIYGALRSASSLSPSWASCPAARVQCSKVYSSERMERSVPCAYVRVHARASTRQSSRAQRSFYSFFGFYVDFYTQGGVVLFSGPLHACSDTHRSAAGCRLRARTTHRRARRRHVHQWLRAHVHRSIYRYRFTRAPERMERPPPSQRRDRDARAARREHRAEPPPRSTRMVHDTYTPPPPPRSPRHPGPSQQTCPAHLRITPRSDAIITPSSPPALVGRGRREARGRPYARARDLGGGARPL